MSPRNIYVLLSLYVVYFWVLFRVPHKFLDRDAVP